MKERARLTRNAIQPLVKDLAQEERDAALVQITQHPSMRFLPKRAILLKRVKQLGCKERVALSVCHQMVDQTGFVGRREVVAFRNDLSICCGESAASSMRIASDSRISAGRRW